MMDLATCLKVSASCGLPTALSITANSIQPHHVAGVATQLVYGDCLIVYGVIQYTELVYENTKWLLRGRTSNQFCLVLEWKNWSKSNSETFFLDKLKEFNTKSKAGPVSMTPEVAKLYKDETERLRRVYGADKEDLSQFPSFKFQ